MLRLAALVLLAGLTATAPVHSALSQQPQNQSESSALSAHNGQFAINPSADITPPQKIIDAVSRAIDAAASKAQSTKDTKQPDNTGWLFNLLLVVFTGGLLIVGAFQALFLKASVDATEKAANAAKASADAVVSQLRSYIQVSVEITAIDQPGPRQVTVEVKNMGQSPAFKYSSWMSVACDKWPSEMTFEKPSFLTKGSTSTLAPGEHAIVTPSISLRDDQLTDLKAGILVLFLYGRVDYTDVFGNPRFVTIRRAQGGRYGFNGRKMAITEDGNDAD